MSGYKESIRKEALRAWERRRNEIVGRWGSLARVVSRASVETAAKMESAREKFNAALGGDDDIEIARRAGVMERGLDAVEKEAIENGYAPNDMCWFDLGVRVDDKRAVAVMNPSDVEYVATQLSKELDDGVVVYSAADIVLMARENQSLLHHLKQRAGAYTTSVGNGKVEETSW